MILFNYYFLTIIDYFSSDMWIYLICEILILGTIVSLASRTSEKILRGLQRTASITIIARGIYDAYNSWKNYGSSSDSDNSGNKDKKKDKVKNQENEPKPVPTVNRINEK